MESYLLKLKNMVFLTIFLIFFISISSWVSFIDLSGLAEFFHNQCLENLNFGMKWPEIYKALVCGSRLPQGELKDIFVKGGLIHLMVVSGAHLLFIERLWQKNPLPSGLKTYGLYLFLIGYALASQFQPPVVRALFSFLLFQLSRSLKLFWKETFITVLSVIFCLVYQASWVYSISFQLSVLACLTQNLSKNTMKRAFFVYISLFPIINRWQFLHPLSILINWMLSPLIGQLLFPLSFLCLFVPYLHILTDSLWTLLIGALKLVRFLPSQSSFLDWSLPENWTWFYIAFVFFFVFVVDLFKKNLFLLKDSKKKNLL